MQKKFLLDIILFSLAIFLLRFPPLYFLGIKNTFLTTHFLSIIVFLSLFTKQLLKIIIRKKSLYSNINTEKILILLFFMTQSISIVETINIQIFIQRYSKIVIGIIVYLIILYFINIKSDISKLLLKSLLYGGIVVIISQLLLLIFPNQYFQIGDLFIYNNVLNITKANFNIGKLFDDSYLEILTSLLVYYFFKRKDYLSKLVTGLLICTIGFVSFVSNFRYRILAYVFSGMTMVFFLKFREKSILNKLFILLILILLIFSSLNPLLKQFSGYTVIDRFTEREEYEDNSSIAWRFNMFNTSIKLAQTNRFGVGIGNMFDFLSKRELKNILGEKTIALSALNAGPHNIFFQFLAETGYPGLIVFILLILFYLKKDFSIIKKGPNTEKMVFISMFWSLIFIAQFFPAINLTFYTLFFVLRALI